jgi:hypothetical protein
LPQAITVMTKSRTNVRGRSASRDGAERHLFWVLPVKGTDFLDFFS